MKVKLNQIALRAKQDKRLKFTSLIHHINEENLTLCYRELKRNKACGIDGVTVEAYGEDLEGNLTRLVERLKSKCYRAKPVRRVYIPKAGKQEKRGLGIPSVSERIAQTVTKIYLEPKAESIFHPDSYGYRPGKSALDAVGVARERCWRYNWCIDLDIRGFFDNLDWELALRALRYHTDCKWMLLYIERWLKAPVQKEDGTLVERTKGTAQGSCISPLIVNIFMHHAFDDWMARYYPRIKFERYSDDIIVHCRSEKQAHFILDKIEQRLNLCKLELHPEKTRIVYCKDNNRKDSHEHESFTFLGYTFRPRLAKDGKGEGFVSFIPAISNQAAKQIRQTIKSWKIPRRTNATLEEIAQVTNPIVRGWVNYYGKYYKSHMYRPLGQIERHLQKWVQWKYKKHRFHKRRAKQWLGRYAKRKTFLFVHWKLGLASAAE